MHGAWLPRSVRCSPVCTAAGVSLCVRPNNRGWQETGIVSLLGVHWLDAGVRLVVWLASWLLPRLATSFQRLE
jgi:hypothetical protein